MTTAPATLSGLIAALGSYDPDTPVRFRTATGDAGTGVHITELKLADIDSIDCGGRRGRWQEAQLQILDGHAGRPLTAGKVQGILARSAKAIPALADAPLSVEFGKDNKELTRYLPGEVTLRDGVAQIALGDDRAVCKPMQDLSCCGAASACCA